jgi:N12 class adenine-specific DNA methylase
MPTQAVEYDPFAPASGAPKQEDFVSGLLPVVRQLENSGTTAVSPRGAVGPYQIMPATARGLGRDPARLTDPQYNEDTARDLLAQLHGRFGDDKKAILAAYNSTPQHAEAYRKNGYNPALLPPETQNYLHRAAALIDPPPAQGNAVPVEGDPFAGQKAVPVDHDPFAAAPKNAPLPDPGIWGAFEHGLETAVRNIGKSFNVQTDDRLANKPVTPAIKDEYAQFAPEAVDWGAVLGLLAHYGKTPDNPQTTATQPFKFSDLVNPKAMAEKTANIVGEGAPSLAGAAVAGPVGAGLVAGEQSLGPYYEQELAKTPHDPQGALTRAKENAGVDAIATGLTWKLFEFMPFKHEVGTVTNEMTGEVAKVYKKTIGDTIKNLSLQGLGIQGGAAVVTQSLHNLLQGKPWDEGLPQAYTQGVIGNTIMAGLGTLLGRNRPTLDKFRKQTGPTPYEPSAHYGAAPPIEPDTGGTGGGAAAAPPPRAALPPLPGRTPAPPAGPAGAPPAPDTDIGLKFPDGRVERVTVKGYSPDGKIAHLEFEDGSIGQALTGEVLRDMAPTPANRAETPPPNADQQLRQGEAPVAPPAFEEAPPPPPSARAVARMAAREPKPSLFPDATHALDMASRLEAAALDETLPMSTEDRQAALLQAGRLRQQFTTAGEETRPGAYRHPLAGEPAADIGELANPRVTRPDLYQGEYQRRPEPPRNVFRETIPEKPEIPKRPEDLLQFLSRRGGLRGDDPYAAGNLQAMDAHRKFIPGAGMLVRKTGGMSLDRAREAAAEAGFGEGYNNFETVDDLLSAVSDSMHGKNVFSMQGTGRDEALRWEQYRDFNSLPPEEDERVHDLIDSLREQADRHGIPYGEDWTAEDLMAAVTEREAIAAERAGGEEPQHMADARELDMDYYLASRWPEVWGELKDEGVAETDPFEGESPTQPEAAAGAGERRGEAGAEAGREEGPPGPGGHAGEPGEGAPAPSAPETLLGAEETPAERRAREGRRTLEEAAQLPRAHANKPQRASDVGLFAPPPEPSLLDLAQENANREPSAAAVEAGNYKKGHVSVQGVPVTIETTAGAERRGVGSDGTPWRVTLNHPYGYVKRSRGADGEQVDVYVGPHPESPDVFVIDQKHPDTGAFDEHKVIMGARSEEQARDIYNAGFSDGSGPARLGAITAMSVDDFKHWLEDTRTGPLAYREPAAPVAETELPTKADLVEEAKDLGLKVQHDASREQIAGAIDLREANLTPDAEAAQKRDEIEAMIDREAAETLPEILHEPGWSEAGPGGALEEPAPAGRPDESREPSHAATGEEEGGAGHAAVPEGGGDLGGEGAAARLPDGRAVDSRGNPIYRKGERVVLMEGPLAGRHGEIIRADGITMRTVMMFSNVPAKEETTYHYTVRTDEGAETYASKFEPETVPPRAVVKDPIWEGKAIEPEALARTIGYKGKDAGRYQDKAAAARLPAKKAEWKRLADKAKEEGLHAQQVLKDWMAKNPGQDVAGVTKPTEGAVEKILAVQQGAPKPQPPVAGVRVTENADRNGVEVRFTAKPDAEVLGRLKAAGFRWSKPQKLWYAKRSDRTLAVANALKVSPEGQEQRKNVLEETPTEQIAVTGAAQAAAAEQDAAEYQPAAMPITAAAPPPPRQKGTDLFSVGDEVAPTPSAAPSLPPREGSRFVTGVSPDGRQATLDGGAVLPTSDIEPISGHGLQKPVRPGTAGERPGPVSGSGEARPAGRPPAGKEPGGTPAAGRPSGTRAEGAGRPAERPPGPAPRRGQGEIADAGLPRAGEGPESGAAGRPDALVKGTNFSIEPGEVAEGRGPKTKATDNLAAISLAKRLLAEDRPATREEQAVLAKYVGWGGLSGAFENNHGRFGAGLEDVGRELKTLLSPDEYRTAAKSTQYAHYTAENVIRSMWDAVKAMGFDGGNVFEPGMGVGHFLGMMPPDIAQRSQYQGIELDHLTADIAKLLYPQSGVRQADFTETPLPDNTFDLVIGNPPFSDTIIKADPKYAARGFMLHDYFFAKSLDAVRPGGLLAFVTSAGTMNKIDDGARRYMAERAEFLGGVRLPSTAFKKNAGTEVTTDVLFFKKRPEQTYFSTLNDAEAAWTQTVQRALPDNEGNVDKVNVSRYFSENPEQVLGQEGRFDKLYKGRYAVHAPEGVDLTENLRAALDRLPKDIYQPEETPRERAEMDFSAPERKDGSFYLQDGRLMQYSGGVGRPVERRAAGVKGGMSASDLERVKKLIPMRDALRDVFAHDLADRPEEAATAREILNRHYDTFVQRFGPINKAEFQHRRPNIIQQESARAEAREQARDRGEAWHEGSFDAEPMFRAGSSMQEVARARQQAREAAGQAFDEGSFDPADMPDIIIEKRPNIDPFMDDPESYRMRAIEDYNDSTGEARKKRIFYESVLTRETEPTLNSANDGVLWSLNKFGRLDLDKVAAQMGRDKHDIVAELGNSIFKVPHTDDTYQTSDEYLSGDIPDKLDEARAAAQHDPDVRRNVEALEAAMPAPLAPSEISMTLGMPWIPPDHLETFARDRLQIGEARIRHNPALGGWIVNEISDGPDMAKWGTGERKPFQLLSDALNRTPPRIYKEIYIPGEGKKREFDPVATQSAQDKYDAIRQEFADWVEGDSARHEELAGVYNNALNRTVLRRFDGSYLTTPGIAADWKWRPHQQRVVARIIQAGNTYVAHAVGAGKTSEMIGAGMEMRRLGLVKKPMYVVPNHMLAQFTKEFYEQYPTARISVADERRFHTDRRKQFVANVAQDDLDAIIITHSAFGKIPISGKFQKQLIIEELDHIQDAMSGLDKQDDRITIKRLENQKEKLEQQLKGAFNASKDKTNTFEEMGIDHLFVDEAHNFRKLNFATRQSTLKGIDPEGSQMAWDLYSKIRYLETKNPGRSVVLASGTPVTNTMGELFTISRYLQRGELQARGIDHFDSWAATFGDTKSSLEQTPDGGYAPVTRFARFVNIPELYKMVGGIMDVVTPAQLDQFVVRPKLKEGKRFYNLAPKTPLLEEYQGKLAARMQAIKARKGKPQKGDDIMLSVINDGRHASIDMRFVDPFAPNDPDSKLNRMIDNVHRIWKETAHKEMFDPRSNYQKMVGKGPATQMIFANLGIGNKGGERFSGYDWMKRELTRRGVPAGEIAFIRDYKSHVARQKLFNDMNEGRIRILIGSTQKMGTGVNAQKRLYAIHNQDPLWFPADDEQRVGRGLRQGNMNPEIEIHDYSTKGTYDATMWQMMGRKGRFIEQFFRGDPELRDMEDLGEASHYEQASAIATTDERLIQLTDLRQQLDKAQRRAAAHDREQYSMRSRLSNAQESIERVDKSVPVINADIKKRVPTEGDAFKMQIGGKTFKDRGEAAEAMKEEYGKIFPGMEAGTEQKIAELGGFNIFVSKEGLLGKNAHFYIQRSNGDLSELGANTPNGVIRSMESRLPKFEGELAYLAKRKEDAEREIASLRSQIGKPFTGGDEITRLKQEVRDLESALAPKKELSVADIDKQIEANEQAYSEGLLTDDDYMQRKIELDDLRRKAAPPAGGVVKAQVPEEDAKPINTALTRTDECMTR